MILPTTFSAQDYTFMSRALQLAELGLNTTAPNPRVGCVIVKDNKIIGEGAHLKAGEPHAEIFAIQQAGDAAKGATLYVTLEPCCHTGRTSPCTHALLEAGISKVICAMQDPNPLVAGQGLAHLQANNIETACGLLTTQAEALNAGFIKRMTLQKPFVRSKIASSLDGKSALANGESKWITSEHARQDVQLWRGRSCAILTGIGTVLSDNPRMNVRLENNQPENVSRQPLKVIVDSQLQTPINANILQQGNVLIAYAIDAHNRADALFEAGAELLCIPNLDGKVDLNALLSHLAYMQINELLVEGGEGLNGALLAQNLIDELLIYMAPKLMGSAAKGLFTLPAFTQMSEVVDLNVIDMRQIGPDIRIRAKPVFKPEPK